MLASSSDRCNGPLTDYVVVARSQNPQGPFVDRDGLSMLDAAGGGDHRDRSNGNRWVGTGHNATFTDFAGQDWFLYHAIDRRNPYFAGATGFTKRPLMLDGLDWIGDWPTVRGGLWASDTSQAAPAAQPGTVTAYRTRSPRGRPIRKNPPPAFSDAFQGSIGAQWQWIRAPASSAYGVGPNGLRFDTQAGELYQDTNSASILAEAAPAGDFLVETELRFNVPASDAAPISRRQGW